MIFVSGANLGDYQEEILPAASEEFPYVCLHGEMDRYIGKEIPWHWHPYFEIDYVEEGEFEFYTTEGVCSLKKGEAVFINSNILHGVRVKEGQRGCRNYALLFDMHFLSGMYNSVFEQNYMLPIVTCRELETYPIRPDCHQRIQMLDLILTVIEQSEKEGFGYEFGIRADLSRFWCMLLLETEKLRKNSSGHRETDISRIKAMMQYIQEHYGEKLSLEEIAKAASISSREGIRCFQKNIGMSPIKYLNDYRIRKAARRLLETGESIMEIGENCGFSSNSYFGKVFRETFGCTPKEYRKRANS